jgi:heme/copper-type cytochrome/quinol oxidase subunit 3
MVWKKLLSDVMSKLRIGFVILVDVLLFIALILIYYIDQMVNGTLYYFGLIFDNGWAQPYYLLSRISVILIIAAIIMISSVELPVSAFKEKN